MGSALRSTQREIGDALGSVARRELGDVAQTTAAGAVRGASHEAAQLAAQQSFKSSIVSTARTSPEVVVQSTQRAVTTVDDGTRVLKNENPATVASSERATLDAAGTLGRSGAAETIAKSKFGLSTGTILAGVGLTAYCVYSLTTFASTDGKTITITNIKRLDSGHIQVSYNPPNLIAFSLRVNDTLDFSGCTVSGCTVPPLGNGERVDRLIDDHNFVIAKSVTYPAAYTPAPTGSPVPVPSPGSSWGTAVVHSSFSNQFIGSVADTTATVLGAGAAVVDEGVKAAAPVASNVIRTGTDLAGQAFCDIIPFLCNSTIWWIIVAVCLFILIGGGAFMVLSKKKT